MIAHIGVLVTLLGAVALILRECGVFESIRRRNLEKASQRNKPQMLKKAQEKERIYDHEYPEDK